LTLIEREIPPIMRNRWLEALSRQFARERKMTLLEYLQEPPRKFAPSTVERQSDTVNRLLDLAVDCYPTTASTPALLQLFAQGKVWSRRRHKQSSVHVPL
jgi:hypothetical protein